MSALAAPDDGDLPLTLVLLRHGGTERTEADGASAPGGAFVSDGASVPDGADASDTADAPLTPRGRIRAAQAADAVFRIGRAPRTGAGSSGGMRSGGLWPDVPRPTALVASPTARTQETAAAVGRRMGLHVTTDDRFADQTAGATAEPADALGARVSDGLADLLAGGTGRTVVVVANAPQLRAVVGQALGAPASHWQRLRVPPASLSVVRFWADGGAEVMAVGVPTDG